MSDGLVKRHVLAAETLKGSELEDLKQTEEPEDLFNKPTLSFKRDFRGARRETTASFLFLQPDSGSTDVAIDFNV